jgi:phage terminase large subunit-like protein
MVEGESGILAVCPPWNRPKYEPSKRRLTWPNGAMATLFSADEPDRLRGPSHDYVWADELAAWRYSEAWDMAMFGLRLGSDPRAVVTTTPKPVKVLRELLELSSTHVTRGTTYENRANLAEAFFEKIIRKYEGTRLGKQELEAILLEDYPGALWTRDNIIRATDTPDMVRVVVAMDPAVSSGEGAAEMGILVCGRGTDDRGYVLADVSRRSSPKEAAESAVAAYHTHRADRIVAEVNNGGEWIEAVIKTVDPSVPYKCLHASRGKVTRAEPIAALYEQGRVSHVGVFDELEDQMCMYVPGDPSPDRMDALVWAFTELALENTGIVEGVQSGSIYIRDDPGY